jgi:hypothetical protein
MARSKPNKSLKSPDKQQMEEQNKQNKTDNTSVATPDTTNTSKRGKRTEETDEQTEKKYISQRKYKWNPENIPYYESDLIHILVNRNDHNKEQFDEDGEVVNSSDEFMQPSNKDAQCSVLAEEEQAFIKMDDTHRTRKKEDTKPAAQLENEYSSPLPEPDQRRLHKQEHKYDHMKKLFATLAKNTQTQLR